LRVSVALFVACVSFVVLPSFSSLVAPEVRAFQAAPRFVRSQLTWFDRGGKKLGVVGNIADYGSLELSPTGDRVGVAVLSDATRGTRSIWLVDVATGSHTVVTSEANDSS